MGTSILEQRRDAVKPGEVLAWLHTKQWEAWSTIQGGVVLRVRHHGDILNAEAVDLIAAAIECRRKLT